MNLFVEDPSELVEIIFGAFFLIEGIVQMATGKVMSYSSFARKYTPASIRRFARPGGLAVALEGFFIMLLGIALGISSVPDILRPIALVGVVGSVILYFVMMKKYLVKLK